MSAPDDPGRAMVRSEVDSRGVAHLTIDRPHVNNAYDGNLIEALHAELDALEAVAGLRAVVVRGAGRHFQAGADLDWLATVAKQSPEDNEEVSRRTASLMRRIDGLPVPTIAQVQGACVGGGTGLIASCDIVVAAQNAQFSVSETRWGMVATIILPQLCSAIGARQVRRYALTGERFGAEQAQRIGLVHEVCTIDQLEATSARLVEQVLMNAPEATMSTKRWAAVVAQADAGDDLLEGLVAEHAQRRQMAEAAEGLASFHQKRRASWYAAEAS